jgi:hypothetical protein
MKANYSINIHRLIPILGIAFVAGGLLGAAIYEKLEQASRSNEAGYAALGRLNLDAGLCQALRTLHQGDVSAAARRLDPLCNSGWCCKALTSARNGRRQMCCQGITLAEALVSKPRRLRSYTADRRRSSDRSRAARHLAREWVHENVMFGSDSASARCALRKLLRSNTGTLRR